MHRIHYRSGYSSMHLLLFTEATADPGHSYVERRNLPRQLPAAIGCLLPVLRRFWSFRLRQCAHCLISDIGEYESCVCRNIGKGVVSVNVCDTSVTCSFHLDRSTNHRTKLSVTVPVTVRFCALACVANRTESNIIPNALKKLDFCFININLISY